ncbi:MAG TPA: cell division protein FtsL [Longimicrobiales bacterium]|nr:cell division protein FtsL [Longimicrobiales bacterium]
MRKGNGAIRMSVAFALLFSSLALVVWRQSRALEELRGLDAVRGERVVLQAERSELQREIQWLESRSRIAAVAAQRLGLRTPGSDEIQFLQLPEDVEWPLPGGAGSVRVAGGRR